MPDFLQPVVAVPARNEEALLPRLVAALGRQTVLARLSSPLEVIIVLNNTTDRSLAAATSVASTYPRLRVTIEDVVYPPDLAHVGSARRHAMERAIEATPRGVILTTDADAVPSDTWIEANLDAIAAGADLVGGRIVGDPHEEARLGPGFQQRAALHARFGALCDELAALIDPLAHDPWPRHHDHTGGSLAVRSEVYREVGGMEALPFREDVAFVSKVCANGFLLVHPLDVVVTVSARTIGRAQGGMADCLSTWIREEAMGVPVVFECPAAVEACLLRRRELRELAAGPTDVARGPVRSEVAAWIERYAPDAPDAPATVPALEAISALANRIASLQGVSHAA